ncbi:amidase domain-containing protein [Streptomyces herbicida]|uniref:amidase domain-containing protein n=1 Tax=Streptomyces herbicida TaxID=3065675 RepID=UPI0038CD3E34
MSKGCSDTPGDVWYWAICFWSPGESPSPGQATDSLHRFLEPHSRGIINTESKQYEAKVGDIVLFNWQGHGGWDHAGVITKMSHGRAYVSAHTGARLNKRLDSYMSTGTWADIFHVIPGWY